MTQITKRISSLTWRQLLVPGVLFAGLALCSRIPYAAAETPVTFSQHCDESRGPLKFQGLHGSPILTKLRSHPQALNAETNDHLVTPGILPGTPGKGAASAPPSGTFLSFVSSPGDYIGLGQTRLFTPNESRFNTTLSPDFRQIAIAVTPLDFNLPGFWFLHLQAPNNQQLLPGVYEGATRWPFQAPSAPGLDLSGDGRGCNMLTGRFEVLEAVYHPSGYVERFHAIFEQHCESSESPALFGEVQILNPLPVLASSITDPTGCTGAGDALNVTLEVTNPNAGSQNGVATATVPPQLLALPGTCSATIGICGLIDASTILWSGTLAPGQKTTITYQVQVVAGTSSGVQFCITSTATLNDSPPASVVACGAVNCAGALPGLPLGNIAEASDQLPGSVLIFNIYTSNPTAPARENARISITNTDAARSVAVHLFFIEGSTCSVADRYICLTQSQTITLLASEQDPGTTGYLVAVAVDSHTGCPIEFNRLIGDEFVKFETGHAANLGAEAIPMIAGGLPLCNANSDSALLSFDGVHYGRVAAVLASSSIQARGDGNDTLLIVNRINGDLRTSASFLGPIFGILYDNSEEPHSFNQIIPTCQLRNTLSNNFPRTTPRFETVIPAGTTGWLKLWSTLGTGLLGSQINLNTNAGVASGAFNQGHNLHKLRLASTSIYTIPIFPPAC